MGSIFFKAMVGMLAGVLIWMMVEPFKPHLNYADPAFMMTPEWMSFENKQWWGWAIALGAAVGFMNGYQRGSRMHALKECAISIAFACIGLMVARGLSGPFGLMTMSPYGPIKFLGRVLALTITGTGLGLGIGLSTFVLRRGIQGAVGGFLGGLISGVLFDLIGNLTGGITLTLQNVRPGQMGETGAMSRGLLAAILCGLIALMIGIIEALFRSAWIRLELGRNEGKEWAIDKGQMAIGRSEKADIPLFGDQAVAQLHAMIHKNGQSYTLVDQGSPVGVLVNGQRVQQAVLTGGDMIQIGSFNLRFLMKNVKVPNKGPEALRGMAAYPAGGPMPQGQPMGVMQPTMMGGMQPMQPTVMNGMQPMQPTMMNPPMGQMQPTMVVPSQPAFQPTVAVPAQPNLQPTIAVQTGMASLVAVDGPLMGQRFPLNTVIELGRESTQVPMSFDTSASRRHARLEPAGLFVNVSDLGSTNGTFVNGTRVSNATAKSGDIVKVGATSFRIES